MTPAKRKSGAAEEGVNSQSEKRVRVEDRKSNHKKQKIKHSDDKTKSLPSAGLEVSDLIALRDDEASFPRGGASVLTPLERKQIHAQAAKDVLFEQRGSKRLANDVKDSEESNEENTEVNETYSMATGAKRPRKRKTSGKKSVEEAVPQDIRIEGLNFKRIVPGSMILGQVSSINAHDIGVSLPNNLTGYVPLTSVSKGMDKKIEEMLSERDSGNEDEEGIDEDSLELHDYFYLGQYLRAYVVSAGSDSADTSTRRKKRIELAVDPRHANTGLSRLDLVENTTIQASVVSVEDHGLIMDLGFEDSNVKGFMSSKCIDPKTHHSSIKEGSVFLCVVTGKNSDGNVIKLSADLRSSGSIKGSHYLSTAPTINSFLPGTAAEILLTGISSNGLTGKIMGMLDATVDLVQSGGNAGREDLSRRFHTGAKIKGRIVCTFPASDPFKVGFSMLDHVLKFSSDFRGPGSTDNAPAISAIVPDTKVVEVDPGLGLYVQIGPEKHMGFVHISKVSDGQVENVFPDQGPYKIGSIHEARIVGYNLFDNLYSLSFEKKIIDQPFLRIEDVTVGAVVKGKIEKLLIGPSGVNGLIVILAEGITGLIPSMHFADVPLQFPEKKFREDMILTARILSVNLEKRQVRLTLKKSLLNSESTVWKDYSAITPGSQSPGTIVSIQTHGAVVQFYGCIRGFLPVSEMSEAYIKDPSRHFRLGQVVNVHALSVDVPLGKLIVSCKDPSTFTEIYRRAFENTNPGLFVAGTVFEKSNDDLLLKLDDSGLVARLGVEQITDGSPSKQASTLSKIRVGQKLSDLLVIDIKRAHRLIKVTGRASLKKAAKQGSIPSKFEEVQEGSDITGFVRNITRDGVFVEFLSGLNGLVPKRLVAEESANMPDFGMIKSQTVSVTVHSRDEDHERFILSMRPSEIEHTEPKRKARANANTDNALSNAVDENVTELSDLAFGRIVKCRVQSVKATQVNVQIAENIQGRIDVSEAFDKWEDIKDRKQPLRVFHQKQVIQARILGIHDARSHKFLPISHRSGKFPVFELSVKPSFMRATNPNTLNLEQVQVGSSWIGYINNAADDCLWVNLSPNVRGRLRMIDATDDLSLLSDMEKHFPIGSALKVQVTSVNVENGLLDLSARKHSDKLLFDELCIGMTLPGRVTKVTEKQVIIQLSDTIVGVVHLIDLADDFSKADPTVYNKNEVLRTCVVGVDKSNKKLSLSLRPSKVLSSSLPVQDPVVSSLGQLKVDDVVRGFVKRVADNGLFITLGHGITAYVRVSDLSDSYLKEWKDIFQVDQLVKGRISLVDPGQGKLQMTLKESALDPNYKTPVTLRDLRIGQVVTGKIRKVEEFGAFIVVEGSLNVSGLCHRSEMAESRVEDARTLYEEGDVVKAKILKIDHSQGRISFGLKASYLEGHGSEGSSDDSEYDDGSEGVTLNRSGSAKLEESDSDDEEEEDDMPAGGVDLKADSRGQDDIKMADALSSSNTTRKVRGLGAASFDWSGNIEDEGDEDRAKPEGEVDTTKGKKSRKPGIQIDRTGELDAHGPQSVADYERLLLGEPDISLLWLKYMAFQLELGEVEKAREIAERALCTITIGQDTEKLNIWVALLNLENTYGDDDSLERVFKRACQYNDTQDIYERMTSIYIQSGKNEKADELFQTALKKKISPTPRFFMNYAGFLFDVMAAPDRGRALLPRALQSLPSHTHVEITSKFGQLEFRSPNGDIERGRTVFEGLMSSFPKRVDLWSVLLDLEMKAGDTEQVRRLFERVLGTRQMKNAAIDESKQLRPKQARFFFKRWLSFEESLASNGDDKMVEEVKAKAAEYVKSLQ